MFISLGTCFTRLTLRATKVNEAVDKSKGNVSKAEDTIEAAQKEINSALEYLYVEGAASLAKARNRSEQFGKQSVDMSDLAKESRLLADKLEKEAQNIRDIATNAYNTSLAAKTLALNGITKQANISTEDHILGNERTAAAGELKSMAELADAALKRARTVYEEALGLYAEVNTNLLPDITLSELQQDAIQMNKTIDQENAELDHLMATNGEMLRELDGTIDRGRELLSQGQAQQEQLDDLLARLDVMQARARSDVELTKVTLTEANNIYKTFKEFSGQMAKSREQAEQAAVDVPAIQEQVAAADSSINSIAEELSEASNKAKEACDLAQLAQKEYAEMASEAAHEIRKKASSSKADARKLRDEAEKLSTREEGTAKQIEELQKQAEDNMQLTRDAEMKVVQANTDAREADKQVSKDLEDLKVITEELQNLPKLDDAALDRLEENLNKVVNDLKILNLDSKIEELKEAKRNHLRWMDQYKEEHNHLVREVQNVKDILKQMPVGCFNNIVLEPTEGPPSKPASH